MGPSAFELQDILSEHPPVLSIHSLSNNPSAHHAKTLLDHPHPAHRPPGHASDLKDRPLRKVQWHLHSSWVLRNACADIVRHYSQISGDKTGAIDAASAFAATVYQDQPHYAVLITGGRPHRESILFQPIPRGWVPVPKRKSESWSVQFAYKVRRLNYRFQLHAQC
jgi:hypothetical protein